ncbi:MAG: DUF378 domain-containing protein [Micavibrio aeruginosavorus]|uniref:DUF378 domain-containing protein n=1 Tax=Micavibrio aeruginosavorus TaxID=349221 RepID=A0A2W4ZFY1_9BACT|nr:MAG: DUF378 domain-containing protein [Micavibrio aeruginosavorus]
MRALNIIALTLVIVGGINWGLFGFFNVDLVAGLFGGPDMPMAKIVYGLVGLAAVYSIFLLKPVARYPRMVHHH